MKTIMKVAVDQLYELLCLRAENPEEYDFRIGYGGLYTAAWDEPAGLPMAGPVNETMAECRMREVNRSAVIVTPRQPFLEWLRAVDPSNAELTLSDLAEEPDIYLVPECESDGQFDRHLRRLFPAIFENELGGWWTDEDAWPTNRTFRLFREWFEIRKHSLLFDLSRGTLNHIS